MRYTNLKTTIYLFLLGTLTFGTFFLLNIKESKSHTKCKISDPFGSGAWTEGCPHIHDNAPVRFRGERTNWKETIINGAGLCLDVHAPDMRNNGGRVQVWQCNGEPQQRWSIRGNSIVNDGGLCLDTQLPDIGNNGGRVQVWQCNGQSQQAWEKL